MITNSKVYLKNTLYSSVFLMLTTFSGCKKDDVVVKGCGGTVVETFDEVTFLTARTHYSFVFLSDEYGIIQPCDGDFVSDFIEQTLGLEHWVGYEGKWVTTSGNLYLPRRNSEPGVSETVSEMMNRKINLATEPYQPKDIIIEVIESEQNGVQGYGYFIEYQGFRIEQTIIPAAEGLQVFKTPEEALIIAYFVAYKLKHHSHDFPSIQPEDLLFFNIDHEY